MLRLSLPITVYCCAMAVLLGACMGSFLNCLAWRMLHGESVLRGEMPLLRRKALCPPCVGGAGRGRDVCQRPAEV